MKLNDEVLEMKKEVREMKEQSIAMEIVKNQKKTIKNIIVAFTSIIIILLVLFGVTIAAFLHYINTTGYEEETINTKSQEIEDVDTIENSNIVNGDLYGENKTNKHNN